MESKSNFVIDIRNHEAAYFIGDVHGDLRAFLKALRLTGCVRVPDDILSISEECPTLDVLAQRDGYPLSEEQEARVRWVGKNNVVIFLGDVIDNRRSNRSDRFGVCAYTGTQFQIMDIILKLQAEARPAGGRVVWCLGNHEVENVTDHQISDFFCKMYAPSVQKASRAGTHYAVCDNKGYSKEHRGRVRARVERAGLCVVVLVHSGTDAVLGCHGGLSDLDVFNKYITLVPEKYAANVDSINAIFEEALIHRHPKAIRFISDNQGKMPTWCRPTSILNRTELMTYFGTSKMVKAHDVQDEPNCTHDGNNKFSEKPFKDGELCRIDTGMSRAFSKQSKMFCCLRVTAKKGGLRRQILVEQ